MNIKTNIILAKTFKSRTAVDVFYYLEEVFQKSPNGFYAFLRPCSNIHYKNGESFAENLGMGDKTVARLLIKMCTPYRSKTRYKIALENLGEDGIFKGMPYLSYRDMNVRAIFYRRNAKIVEDILKGATLDRK